MNYSNYLKSSYWKNLRENFIRNAHTRCFICRSKGKLELHHKRYERKGESILGNERHNDLRLLCPDCHYKIHKYHLEEILAKNLMKRRKLRDWLKTLRGQR